MSKPTVNGRLIGPEISGEMGLAVWEGSRKRASLEMAWKTTSAVPYKAQQRELTPACLFKA